MAKGYKAPKQPGGMGMKVAPTPPVPPTGGLEMDVVITAENWKKVVPVGMASPKLGQSAWLGPLLVMRMV